MNYHFKITGKVVYVVKKPMGEKAFLEVMVLGGTDQYPKHWPVAFFGDDAKTLSGVGLQPGEKVTLQGFISSKPREYNGQTFYNLGLTGKDITRDVQQVAAPEPQANGEPPTLDSIPF